MDHIGARDECPFDQVGGYAERSPTLVTLKHSGNWVSQGSKTTPNVRASRELDKLELAGRRAGDRYWSEAIGTTRWTMIGRHLVAVANQGVSAGRLTAASIIALAKSYHVVWPAAVV
jgi:hypothetical protein